MKRAFLLLALLATNAQAMRVTATAYSLHGLTAKGTRAGPGTIAVSRDLLGKIPYYSTVRLSHLTGSGCHGFRTAELTVLDTMRADKYNTVDVWLPSYSKAIKWGHCKATITIIKKGRGR